MQPQLRFLTILAGLALLTWLGLSLWDAARLGKQSAVQAFAAVHASPMMADVERAATAACGDEARTLAAAGQARDVARNQAPGLLDTLVAGVLHQDVTQVRDVHNSVSLTRDNGAEHRYHEATDAWQGCLGEQVQLMHWQPRWYSGSSLLAVMERLPDAPWTASVLMSTAERATMARVQRQAARVHAAEITAIGDTLDAYNARMRQACGAEIDAQTRFGETHLRGFTPAQIQPLVDALRRCQQRHGIAASVFH